MKEAHPTLWWKVTGEVASEVRGPQKYVCHVSFWDLDRDLIEQYIAANYRDKEVARQGDDRRHMVQAVVWKYFRDSDPWRPLGDVEADPIPRSEAPSDQPTREDKEKGWRLWVKRV